MGDWATSICEAIRRGDMAEANRLFEEGHPDGPHEVLPANLVARLERAEARAMIAENERDEAWRLLEMAEARASAAEQEVQRLSRQR